MRRPELKRITVALRQLTPDQRKSVAVELAALDAQHVIRNGHANGLQRYRCRECCKTFSALTGTPLNRLHKRGKWLDQAHALQDGQALREIARALRIHLSTAHRWRHRFLAAPKTVQPQALTGIAEADENDVLAVVQGKRSGLDRKAR